MSGLPKNIKKTILLILERNNKDFDKLMLGSDNNGTKDFETKFFYM